MKSRTARSPRPRGSRIRLLVLWVLICLLPFSLPVTAGAISIQDETLMGQKFLESIRRQLEILDDDFASDYMNDLGQYLIQGLETRPFPFQFYVIRENSLNAFAGPGGHIFMFSGLISTMEGVDELAAVLTHEIGHVSARHLSERMSQGTKMNLATLAGILAGVLLGGPAGGAIATGTLAGSIQKQLAYSREDERQADQLGFQYISKSGFDPSGMITTLIKLDKGQYRSADAPPPYLLTHPGGPERISNIESMLSTQSQRETKEQTKRFRDLFPFFKTVVQARTGEPHDMEALYRKALAVDAGAPLANFGLGIVYQQKSEHDKATEHLKIALRSNSDSIPVLRKLAESYQLQGLDREAAQILERAVRVDNQDKASLLLLAKSYQNMEEDQKAIRIFERLLLMRPVKIEIYHSLGVSYGRENRLALAHYNFGLYFKRLGQRNKARFHFQKAEELSRGDPVLGGKIREETEELRRGDR
jgi:beta-barrel assembly-enhancing protease